MSGPAQSGLFIYANDVDKLARFYGSVLGMTPLSASRDLVVMQSPGIQIVFCAIPPQVAKSIEAESPPKLRDDAAFKFFFTIPSIDRAQDAAVEHGGHILPDRWQGPGFVACNACDPEGNIVQLRERTT